MGSYGMFLDVAKVYVKAGDGGAGAVTFHREKYVAAAVLTAGDGGRGGDIVFQVDDNFSTLVDFRFKKKYVAPNGEPGRAKSALVRWGGPDRQGAARHSGA